jgi:hypothetical protein
MNKSSDIIKISNKVAVVIGAIIPMFFIVWSFIDFVEKYLGYEISIAVNIVLSCIISSCIAIYASASSYSRRWIYGSWTLFFIIKLSSEMAQTHFCLQPTPETHLVGSPPRLKTFKVLAPHTPTVMIWLED